MIIVRTDDPIADYHNYCYQMEKEEEGLPTCSCCGSAVDETFYEINGEIYCKECLDDLFMHYV